MKHHYPSSVLQDIQDFMRKNDNQWKRFSCADLPSAEPTATHA